MAELIIDLFAGGGGASLGIYRALGRHPDIAINHDGSAVAMHRANHPGTYHYQQDVWSVLPRQATKGEPVRLLWASPDCTHFSRAKGGPPIRDVKRRDLAWVVVRWAEEVRPRVIILENVEEFRTWGPLDSDNKIIASQKGSTYRAWVKRLRRLGYEVESQCLRACDYGAPTSRKRLFMIARCDGQPIIWPAPTHGDSKSYQVASGQLLPWRPAAEIIDWSIPCLSIFERKKPLAENTLKRIAEGIRRYVLDAAEPFIVTYYGPKRENDFRGRGLDEPLPTQGTENRFGLVTPYIANLTHGVRLESAEEPIKTITAGHRGEKALISPYLARIGQTRGNGKYCNSPDEPITTVTSKAEHLLVTPYLVGSGGPIYSGKPAPVDQPLGTVMVENHRAIVVPHLQRQFGQSIGNGVNEPVGTITAGFGGKTALVSAFMAQHNGGMIGHEMTEPVSTLTHRCTQQQVVTSHLVKLKGTSKAGQPVSEPIHTIQSGGQHYGEVRAFLTKYYGEGIGSPCSSPVGTLTSKDRMGLVTVLIEGEIHVMTDIGMRMLSPRELYRAQGFGDDYVIDVDVNGRPITKSDQVRLCGNSVSPDNAEALISANLTDYAGLEMQRQTEIHWS
ncbi:MAG: DNA cytosine methyltransferase [Syntrophobacteraceae bacterium]